MSDSIFGAGGDGFKAADARFGGSGSLEHVEASVRNRDEALCEVAEALLAKYVEVLGNSREAIRKLVETKLCVGVKAAHAKCVEDLLVHRSEFVKMWHQHFFERCDANKAFADRVFVDGSFLRDLFDKSIKNDVDSCFDMLNSIMDGFDNYVKLFLNESEKAFQNIAMPS